MGYQLPYKRMNQLGKHHHGNYETYSLPPTVWLKLAHSCEDTEAIGCVCRSTTTPRTRGMVTTVARRVEVEQSFIAWNIQHDLSAKKAQIESIYSLFDDGMGVFLAWDCDDDRYTDGMKRGDYTSFY